jgi:hypothetical protein
MNKDTGYLFIYHFPLFPRMYVVDYVKTLYFDEKTCVYRNFVLDYVQRVENVDFIYTELMNSNKVEFKLNIEINGIKFDLYHLYFSFEELTQELIKANVIDKFWSVKYYRLKDDIMNIEPVDELENTFNELSM